MASRSTKKQFQKIASYTDPAAAQYIELLRQSRKEKKEAHLKHADWIDSVLQIVLKDLEDGSFIKLAAIIIPMLDDRDYNIVLKHLLIYFKDYLGLHILIDPYLYELYCIEENFEEFRDNMPKVLQAHAKLSFKEYLSRPSLRAALESRYYANDFGDNLQNLKLFHDHGRLTKKRAIINDFFPSRDSEIPFDELRNKFSDSEMVLKMLDALQDGSMERFLNNSLKSLIVIELAEKEELFGKDFFI